MNNIDISDISDNESKTTTSEKLYNGFIYVLINNLTSEIFYVGCTTQTLNRRLSEHKSRSYNEIDRSYNNKKYSYIREVGRENIGIIPVTTFRDVIKKEMKLIEKEYIKNANNLQNKTLPIISVEEKLQYRKEYYINNQEKINKKNKEYYINNKEKINKYTNEKGKRVIKCYDCGFTHTYSHKLKHQSSRLHKDGMKLCSLD